MRRGTWIVRIILIAIFAALGICFFRVADVAHRFDAHVKQKAQFNAMYAAVVLFRNEAGSYPPSDANDLIGAPYCGAMKLAEALMGRDLLGFHPQSVFRRDGLDPNTLASLYPANPSQDNLKVRIGPYLASENSNAWRLADVYGKGKTGAYSEDTYVLCDIFERKRPSGEKTGMPILYYKANRSGTAHRAGDPNNVYDCRDNQMLIALGIPGKPGKVHPLIDPERFYLTTRNDKMSSKLEPHRLDSYILISAGRDGLYGTADDICNFEWRYREP